MNWGAAAMFLGSLTFIPVSYLLNNMDGLGPFGCFAAAGVCCILVTLLPYFVVRNSSKKPDRLYYVLGLFMFGCVADIMLALENDGYVTGFTGFYLKLGEAYFTSSHGLMLLYWDGSVQFGLYITMLAAQTYNQSYREVGLYWCGSIINSMLILLPSAVLGKYGLQWSYLLNVPFIIIPVAACVNFLSQRPTPHPQHKLETSVHIWRRPVDALIVLYLISAACFTMFRGLTVLDCKLSVCEAYLKYYEPYLEEDSIFPKMQMLVYLFYLVPYHIYAAYAISTGNYSMQLSDLSLIHAGASAQGIFSHMGASFHSRTPFLHRVPAATTLPFLLTNGAMFIVPHLMLFKTSVSDARVEDVREMLDYEPRDGVLNETKLKTT